MLSEDVYNLLQINQSKFIDVVSPTMIFIGITNNLKDTAAKNWSIQKISQVGTVWRFEYPYGDQNFAYVWDNRNNGTYTYQ